jgi:hypothetical protein
MEKVCSRFVDAGKKRAILHSSTHEEASPSVEIFFS